MRPKKLTIRFTAVNIKEDDVMIHIRVIIKRAKCEFSTGLRGSAKDWSNESQRFVESSNYNKTLNQDLLAAASRLKEIYEQYCNRGVAITATMLRDEFHGIKDVRLAPELIAYVEAFIARITATGEYAEGTLEHYRGLLKQLKSFLKSISEEGILLTDFKRKHLTEFRDYLKTSIKPAKDKFVSPATITRHLSKLRAIFNDARMREIILGSPFFGFKMERSLVTREALTRDELILVQSVDLSKNESLQKVRNIFLFSVYTGLRFSDAIGLKRSDVVMENGRYRLCILQQKTGVALHRTMLNDAVELYHDMLQKYPTSEYVLPRISNQKLNAYLHVIQGIAGLTKSLTHHLARHTFATTILLEQGVDMTIVSHLLGHRSIKTTQQSYAKVTRILEEQIIDLVNNKKQTTMKNYDYDIYVDATYDSSDRIAGIGVLVLTSDGPIEFTFRLRSTTINRAHMHGILKVVEIINANAPDSSSFRINTNVSHIADAFFTNQLTGMKNIDQARLIQQLFMSKNHRYTGRRLSTSFDEYIDRAQALAIIAMRTGISAEDRMENRDKRTVKNPLF